jgi:hypothetical protein
VSKIDKPALRMLLDYQLTFILRDAPFTSLIRLNPQEQPAAGETAGPVVLGEAGKSPAEKKSP